MRIRRDAGGPIGACASVAVAVAVAVIVVVTGGRGDAQTSSGGPDAALATLCVALRAVNQLELRDHLGCSPDQPLVPAELRPCRVSHVSIPASSDHSRTTTTFAWSDAGRLERMELSGNVRHFEHDSARLSAIRSGDATGRDVEITYGDSEIVVESRMRSGIGLHLRTRYVHEGTEVVRIESITMPLREPGRVVELRRTGGRLVELVDRTGEEARTERIEWDRRGRPRRWVRDEDSYTFEWDARDRLVRATPRLAGASARDVAYDEVEYQCDAPPAPVRTRDGILFCRASADCGSGERCVHDRGSSRGSTYCTRAPNDGMIPIDPG